MVDRTQYDQGAYRESEAPAAPAPMVVELPTTDVEYLVTEDLAGLPGWIDPGNCGAEPDPDNPGMTRKCIHMPITAPGAQPYTTVTAHVGDTIRYFARVDGRFGKVLIEPKIPEEYVAGAPAP